MNKPIIISAALTLLIQTQGAFADYTDTKKASAFITSSIAGAALGGPVGFVLGSLGGAWLGQELEQADHVDGYKKELSEASVKVVELNEKLQVSEQKNQEFAQMAIKPFELQMLFKTNQSELTSIGEQQIGQLVKYLSTNPKIFIQLDGFADPRGTNQGNLVLSQERVDAIKMVLIDQGLSSNRIVGHSHGSDFSQAAEGDLKAYAKERVVKIKVYRDNSRPSVEQVSSNN